MGYLKLLLTANRPEGLREAMRISYKRARSRAEKSGASSAEAHEIGLRGALSSRLVVNGFPPVPEFVEPQLLPFLVIEDARVSVEALAEYCLLMERPKDARKDWLSTVLSDALCAGTVSGGAASPFANPAVLKSTWYSILREDARQRIFAVTKSDDVCSAPAPPAVSIGHALASIACVPPDATLADGRSAGHQIRREMQSLRIFAVEFTTFRLLGNTPAQRSIVDEFYASLMSRLPPSATRDDIKDSAGRLAIYGAVVKTSPDGILSALARQFAMLVSPGSVDPILAATGELVCTEVTAQVARALEERLLA
jgi:hypothetical protein